MVGEVIIQLILVTRGIDAADVATNMMRRRGTYFIICLFLMCAPTAKKLAYRLFIMIVAEVVVGSLDRLD